MSDQGSNRSPSGVKTLVFGILSIVFCSIPVFNIIWAIIASGGAKTQAKDYPSDPLVKTGKILSLVGLILSIIMIAYYAIMLIVTIVAAISGAKF